MEFKVLTKEEINKAISDEIIELVNSKKDTILGLATGSSPLGVYHNLVEACKDKKVSFKNVRTFNLDEYVGLDIESDQSYRYFMNHNLFDLIDIDKNNTRVPEGKGDYVKAASEYDVLIAKAGGVDLQVLGIGSDGHIAFNEPGTPLDSLTHVAELAESTIKDNARFFNSIDDVPTKAVSMGLASIMKSRRIVLIATGKNKAQAIKALKECKAPYVDLPCSVLVNHPNCTIYCDSEAFGE